MDVPVSLILIRYVLPSTKLEKKSVVPLTPVTVDDELDISDPVTAFPRVSYSWAKPVVVPSLSYVPCKYAAQVPSQFPEVNLK